MSSSLPDGAVVNRTLTHCMSGNYRHAVADWYVAEESATYRRPLASKIRPGEVRETCTEQVLIARGLTAA